MMMLQGHRQAQTNPFNMQVQRRPHLKRPFALSASPSPSSSPLPHLSSAYDCDYEPTAKRNIPSASRNGFNDKTYAQRFRERLEGYRACREKELGEPFNPNRKPSCSRGISHSPDRTVCEEDYDDDNDDDDIEVLALDSVPLDGGCRLADDEHGDNMRPLIFSPMLKVAFWEDVHAQPQPQPQFLPKHETEHYAPLSNDAISTILLECAPHSPSAQTWIKAHRANKIDKEKKSALLKQQDDLRRQVLQLRPKSEWTMNRPASVPVLVDDGRGKEAGPGDRGNNSAEGREINTPSETPSCEQYNDLVGLNYRGCAYILNEVDKQWMKVFRSTGRLQVAACHEEASIIPARTVREFQRYFNICDER
ncbi:hypothetical protein BDW75DRAFT_157956 [Aspergillus navahoensis]